MIENEPRITKDNFLSDVIEWCRRAARDLNLKATTEWVLLGFAASIGVNGYLKLPTWLGGLILQWGFGNINANTNSSGNWWGSLTVTFPIAFVSVPRCVLATAQDTSGVAPYSMTWNNRTASQIEFQAHAAASTGVNFYWFALGT